MFTSHCWETIIKEKIIKNKKTKNSIDLFSITYSNKYETNNNINNEDGISHQRIIFNGAFKSY